MRKLFFLLPVLLAGCGDFSHSDAVTTLSAADINLDGFADLIVGAPFHDGGGAAGANRGAVYIFFGSSTGVSAAPDITIFGSEDGALFGSSVALVGDVNAGGAPDILVGAPLNDGDGNSTDEGTNRGRAFIFFGGTGMDTIADVTMTGAEPAAQLGFSAARAGDVNVDGFDDWLVGAPFDDGDGNGVDNATDFGRAFLYFGSSTPDGAADVTFTGAEAASRFGWAVASAGDINAGGASDIAVGAPLDDAGAGPGADRGRVYVFYGGSVLDNVADLTLTGDENGTGLGWAVAPVFDVNNDNVDDLLVGGPGHDAGGAPGADRGRAYVFFGGTSVDTVADITISGPDVGGRLGEAVSRAGDVNGDGENDFLVGAALEDPGAIANAGRVYLFLGGSAVDGISDVTFAGTEAQGQFGSSVGGFGDVNGGGRDVYVGAKGDDTDGNATDDGLNRGRAFIFFGGTVLDNVADVTRDGDQDGAEFGTIGN